MINVEMWNFFSHSLMLFRFHVTGHMMDITCVFCAKGEPRFFLFAVSEVILFFQPRILCPCRKVACCGGLCTGSLFNIILAPRTESRRVNLNHKKNVK